MNDTTTTSSIPKSDTWSPLRFHGHNKELLYDHSKEVLFDGARGTGKTTTLLQKAHIYLCNFPKSRILSLRKTRKSITSSTIPTFENIILEPNSHLTNFILKAGGNKRYRQSYMYPNGSELELGSCDDIDSFKSSDYDMILIEESESVKDINVYLTLLPCLRNSKITLSNGELYHSIICACNPGAPSHWLNQRALQGHMKRISSRISDNPRHWDYDRDNFTPVGKDYYSVFDSYPEHIRARYYKGEWVAASGLVYPRFDRDIHMVHSCGKAERFDETICAVDWGHSESHPCAMLVISKANNSKLYVRDESYTRGETIDDIAKLCKELKEKYEISSFVCDSANKGNIDFFNKFGLRAITVKKQVLYGISLVTQRLTVGDDGEPGIYFSRKLVKKNRTDICDSMIDEFGLYSWDIDKNGVQQEKVIKKYDDGLDALRYGISYYDQNSDRSDLWQIF